MFKNLSRGACALLAALAACSGAAAAPSPASTPAGAKAPLVVGFVYVTPVGEAGWTYQHELGRREMERALGARVQDDRGRVGRRGRRCRARAARPGRAAGRDARLRDQLRLPRAGAARRRRVSRTRRFEHAGGYKSAANLATYDARYYEARWLAGWLAGRTSRSGVAGYVAGFPVPEVVQGINAFALGMRAANPKRDGARGLAEHLVRPGEGARRGAVADRPGRRRAHPPQRVAGGRAGGAGELSLARRPRRFVSERHARLRARRAAGGDRPPLGRLLHARRRARARRQLARGAGVGRHRQRHGRHRRRRCQRCASDVRAGLQARRAAIVAGTLAPFAAPLRRQRRRRRAWRVARSPTPRSSRWTGSSPASSATCRRRAEAGAQAGCGSRRAQGAGERAGAPGRTRRRPCRGCPSSRCRGCAPARASRPPAPAATYHGSRCSSVGCISTACGAWLR